MPTTAVIGATSPVGGAIARRLRLAGHEVVEASTEISVFDLKGSIAGASAVVHAAEPTSTLDVLEAASGIGAEQVVILSSAAVYGAWPDNPVPLTEDAVLRPNPGVGPVAARAESERTSAEWALDHPSCVVTILRPATVVAPNQPDWPSDGLDGIAGLGSGDGTRPVQFLHIEDLAAAVVTVIDARIGGVRNVAPEGWIAEDEARALSGDRVLAAPEPLRHLAARLRARGVGRAVNPLGTHPWVVASDALRAEGWLPVYDNREALVATRRPTWFQKLSPTHRQELSLAVIGSAGAATLGAVVFAVLRRRRRRA